MRTYRRPSWSRRQAVAVAAVTAAGAVVVQCTAAPRPPAASSPPTAAAPAATTTPAPSPSPSTSAPRRPAGATVQPVTPDQLGASWRPGCPVEPEQLRRVELDHLGFDGQIHRGELIVHEDLVGEVIEIFDQLSRLRFPIEKIRNVVSYPDAEDELSMRDNNTSAFNCRGIPGTDRWSLHAYGRAIDVNPLLNPYIDSAGEHQPQNAGPYLDRTRIDPGLLRDGDPAVRAFTDRGWRWGGHWGTPKDYQHFERR